MSALVRIKNVYYFRMRIPKDIEKYFSRSEIVKSTHSKKYHQAKGLVRGLLGKTETLFMVLRSKTLDDAAITKIVRDFVEGTLELKYDLGEELINAPEASDDMQKILSGAQQKIKHAVKARSEVDGLHYMGFSGVAADYLCESAGYDVKEDSPAFKKLVHQLAIAKRDIAETLQQRIEDGDSAYDKSERLKPKSHTLTDAIESFVTDKSQGRRKRTEKTRKLLECFQYEIGRDDILLSQIDNAITRKVAERLQRYPLYRNMRYKGLTLKQIYKLSDIEYPSPGLQEEELFFMSSFYQHAIDKLDGITRNFAKGLVDKLVPKSKKKASEYRDIFRPQDRAEIIRELLRRKVKGEFVDNPHLLLIPLIGMYQGMRANEICQLYIEDIAQVDGLWCISVNEEIEGKSVKNVNSRRVLPIHPALEEFGLIRFWQQQKDRGYARLWEGEGKVSCACYVTESRETHAHYFCKWFNRTFKNHLELSNPTKQSFHSLRHSFIDWLWQNLNVNEHGQQITAISGHLDKDDISTARAQGFDLKAEGFVTYAKDLNVHRQYETLKLLDYGIDLSELKFI